MRVSWAHAMRRRESIPGWLLRRGGPPARSLLAVGLAVLVALAAAFRPQRRRWRRERPNHEDAKDEAAKNTPPAGEAKNTPPAGEGAG